MMNRSAFAGTASRLTAIGAAAALPGEGPIDQIQFMHDHGFRAIEDNGNLV